MQTPRAARPCFWAFFAISHIILWGGLISPLQAQVAPLTKWVGGPFSVVVVRPTVPTDGSRFDCAPGTDGCRPLNLARCLDPTPLPIEFVIAAGGSGQVGFTGNNQVLYAFLGTSAGCVYSATTGYAGYNPNLLIGTNAGLAGSAPFFTGGTLPFRFPQGVSNFNAGMTQAGSTGVFTVGEMLQALGVCPPNPPVQVANYFLCVGVDSSNTQGINNGPNTAAAAGTAGSAQATGVAASSGQDPVSYLQFQIDTKPPEAPAITAVRNLNGRCKVDVTYDISTLDTYALKVRATGDPQNLGRPCNEWTGDIRTVSQNVYRQNSPTINFTVDNLSNDVTYAFCAAATDYMENDSEPSAVVTGNPRFECDLFGCYPDELQTGFCAQAAAPQMWGVTGAAILWRLARAAAARRRLRRSPGPTPAPRGHR